MAPQEFLQSYEKSLEFTARSEPDKIIRMLRRRIKESSCLSSFATLGA
jgi:hypothetical protein